MSGIFFDLPSVRFLRRFRFLGQMLQELPASLFRWLSAPVCASRQVGSRYDEAEFPSASRSACNKFDSALDESRATDAEEIRNAFEQNKNRRRRRKRRFGNGLPSFSGMAARRRKQQHNRGMSRSLRDPRANPNGLKSRRPVFTLAISRSMRQKAISSSCSTVSDTCKTRRS